MGASRAQRLKNRILLQLRSEEGGAIVEFVALALPLFIPIFIYLNHYGQISDTESSLRTLAREMSRAVVISENDAIAERVAAEIFIKGGASLGLEEEIISGDIRYFLQCNARPCIGPDNQVEVRIMSNSLNRTISAVEYVSPWA
jgi:Flp pilus assembly protein TadG